MGVLPFWMMWGNSFDYIKDPCSFLLLRYYNISGKTKKQSSTSVMRLLYIKKKYKLTESNMSFKPPQFCVWCSSWLHQEIFADTLLRGAWLLHPSETCRIQMCALNSSEPAAEFFIQANESSWAMGDSSRRHSLLTDDYQKSSLNLHRVREANLEVLSLLLFPHLTWALSHGILPHFGHFCSK